MQLPNVTQEIRNYLANKPELRQKYVDLGMLTVNYALRPVNAVMKHLILVQGLNPNANPGERDRQELERGMNQLFDRMHDQSFDEEYNFSWVNQKFEETRKKLSELDLTRDQFRKYTNVGNLQMQQALDVDQVKNPLNADIPPDVSTKEGRVEYRSRVLNTQVAESPYGQGTTVSATTGTPPMEVFDPVDELADLLGIEPYAELPNDLKSLSTFKGALETVFKHADLIEDETFPTREEVKDLVARTEYLSDVKKAVKDYQKTGDESKLTSAVGSNLDHLPRRVLEVKSSKIKRTKKTANKTSSKPASKVAKEAKAIDNLINQNLLDINDLDKLITEGLDAKVVSYWKKHYNRNVIMETAKDNKVKLAEARRVVNEMVVRGLCDSNEAAVQLQIEEIMKFDLKSFGTLERVVLRHPGRAGSFQRFPHQS